MTRPALIALLAVAACAAGEPAQKPSPIGDVQVGNDIWPIEETAPGHWRVMVDRQPVACSKPLQEACYWSVRNHLQAQKIIDDLG